MATMTPIDLLLLDEHTAALDPKTSQDIMDLTNRIVTEKHITTLMVTHNLRFAVEYGSRLMMFNKGTAVIDKAGQDKQKLVVDDLLKTFNEISIECGNQSKLKELIIKGEYKNGKQKGNTLQDLLRRK